MEAQDPLSELADIHLPAAVSFWPPAIGWWILLALLLTGGFLLLRQWLKYAMTRKKQASALRELELVMQRYRDKSALGKDSDQAGLDYLGEINAILRRVALVFYPQHDVASLSSTQWLRFLDHSGNTLAFSSGPGQALGDAAYRRSFEADAEAVYELARTWIRSRYRQAGKWSYAQQTSEAGR